MNLSKSTYKSTYKGTYKSTCSPTCNTNERTDELTKKYLNLAENVDLRYAHENASKTSVIAGE